MRHKIIHILKHGDINEKDEISFLCSNFPWKNIEHTNWTMLSHNQMRWYTWYEDSYLDECPATCETCLILYNVCNEKAWVCRYE